jgi:hypothetical protein
MKNERQSKREVKLKGREGREERRGGLLRETLVWHFWGVWDGGYTRTT